MCACANSVRPSSAVLEETLRRGAPVSSLQRVQSILSLLSTAGFRLEDFIRWDLINVGVTSILEERNGKWGGGSWRIRVA